MSLDQSGSSVDEVWPPLHDRIVEVLREAREGLHGKNDGWLNARQITDVIISTERPGQSSPPIEILTSVWPVRRALRTMPHEVIEKRVVRGLTHYRLQEGCLS